MLGEALHVLAGGTALEEARTGREEAELVGDDRDLLRHREREDLAHVLGLEPAELLAVLVHQVGHRQQRAHALARRGIEPGVVERLAGGLDRAVDVVRRALGDLRDHVAVGGADDLAGVAVGRVDELAADVHLVGLDLGHRGTSPSGRGPVPGSRGRPKYAETGADGATRRTGRGGRRPCTERTTSRLGWRLLGREQLPRAQREPELHPVEARRQVAAGELLHLAHPVAEGVTVDVQLGRGALPPGVVLEERAERALELAALALVVRVERREQGVGEGSKRAGVRHRQQEPVGPQILEPGRVPSLRAGRPGARSGPRADLVRRRRHRPRSRPEHGARRRRRGARRSPCGAAPGRDGDPRRAGRRRPPPSGR